MHYNYVSALLNDVFGIQSRGGCVRDLMRLLPNTLTRVVLYAAHTSLSPKILFQQCAGPYSQRLLGLTVLNQEEEVPSETNRKIEKALVRFK